MPGWFWQISARVRAFLRTRSFDRDFDEELKFHLDMLAEDHQRRGMSPEDALRAARLELGRLAQLRDAHRDLRGMPWLSDFSRLLQHVLRALLKTPGFTLTVLAILSVGIGATTAVFSVVNSILVKPLPYPKADLLAGVGMLHPALQASQAFLAISACRLRCSSLSRSRAGCFSRLACGRREQQPSRGSPNQSN